MYVGRKSYDIGNCIYYWSNRCRVTVGMFFFFFFLMESFFGDISCIHYGHKLTKSKCFWAIKAFELYFYLFTFILEFKWLWFCYSAGSEISRTGIINVVVNTHTQKHTYVYIKNTAAPSYRPTGHISAMGGGVRGWR